jgi:hypothetical protein
MLFDGAFHVPSWLRQLAIVPVDLIEHCRREEGAGPGLVSLGALGLAKWLLDDVVRAEREARTPGSPLSMGGVITRLLAGTAFPGDEQAAAIERMTGGEVVWSSWIVTSNEQAGGLAPEPMPEPEAPAEPVLGQTASGPLWTARLDRKRIIVSGGLAIDMAMELSAGACLHASLGAALAEAGALPAARA